MSTANAPYVQALAAIAAGRVQYGATHPDRDRREYTRATRNGATHSPRHSYLLDGKAVSARKLPIYERLTSLNLVRVRHDTVAHHKVPERRVTVPTAAGTTTRIMPARREPTDPGWRCAVELAPAGRDTLDAAARLEAC